LESFYIFEGCDEVGSPLDISGGVFKCLQCDFIEEKEFDSEEDFQLFVHINRSCSYAGKKVDTMTGKIKAIFAMYYHKVADDIRHDDYGIPHAILTTDKLGYNLSPIDENYAMDMMETLKEESRLKYRLGEIEKIKAEVMKELSKEC
jgi:hypothetical protein